MLKWEQKNGGVCRRKGRQKGRGGGRDGSSHMLCKPDAPNAKVDPGYNTKVCYLSLSSPLAIAKEPTCLPVSRALCSLVFLSLQHLCPFLYTYGKLHWCPNDKRREMADHHHVGPIQTHTHSLLVSIYFILKMFYT